MSNHNGATLENGNTARVSPEQIDEAARQAAEVRGAPAPDETPEAPPAIDGLALLNEFAVGGSRSVKCVYGSKTVTYKLAHAKTPDAHLSDAAFAAALAEEAIKGVRPKVTVRDKEAGRILGSEKSTGAFSASLDAAAMAEKLVPGIVARMRQKALPAPSRGQIGQQ